LLFATTSGNAWRQAIPFSSAPSVPRVSLRPSSHLDQRSASHAAAPGEDSISDIRRVVRRFRELCARLGTEARHENGRCVVSLS